MIMLMLMLMLMLLIMIMIPPKPFWLGPIPSVSFDSTPYWRISDSHPPESQMSLARKYIPGGILEINE
jgi:hypothetical protein